MEFHARNMRDMFKKHRIEIQLYGMTNYLMQWMQFNLGLPNTLNGNQNWDFISRFI